MYVIVILSFYSMFFYWKVAIFFHLSASTTISQKMPKGDTHVVKNSKILFKAKINEKPM